MSAHKGRREPKTALLYYSKISSLGRRKGVSKWDLEKAASVAGGKPGVYDVLDAKKSIAKGKAVLLAGD